MKKTFLLLITIMVLFSLSGFSFLQAEIYIKTDSHTDAFEMMGKKNPAKDESSEQWIGDARMAFTGKGQTTVIDLGEKTVYLIYHQDKAYVEAPLPLDMKKLMPEEMLAMLSMWKIKANVAPNGETQKIGQWNCTGYNMDINMGMLNIKIKTWATPEVPFDWKSFTEKMYPTLLQAVMGQGMDEETLNQYKKIDGYQVATSVTVNFLEQEIKTASQIVEISDKPAPPGIFSVPAGYKKLEKLVMSKWGI
ncbi:MAG: hypothetical protein NT166_03325 [Candidatus Aminicenantes bacterium]|nr:hypothetical protein [Candidatus Aminicenantes bacterium]